MTSRQEVIRVHSWPRMAGKMRVVCWRGTTGCFEISNPGSRTWRSTVPDHGDPEYQPRIERLVSQFREWRSQPRQKPKDIYSQ
jgi:hypothetical protein